MHVVAHCSNRELYFTVREDSATMLTLHAYTLRSNHVHLLLEAPRACPVPGLSVFFRSL